MAIDNFIPTVWSARLLANLHAMLVYAQPGIARRDYEGELANGGDTVKINSIGPVTIGDYTKNTDHAGPETLTDATQSIVINQRKMFNFQVDDIDQAQQRPKVMDEAMREAAYGLATIYDSFVAGFYTAAHANNLIGSDSTPTVLSTPDSVYDLLVDLSVKLDESDVPSEDRWVVLAPWQHGLILKDERFVKTGSAQAEDRLRNGRVGEAAGFTVLKSNRVPTVTSTKFKVMAGQGEAIQVADSVSEIKAYEPENRFADAVKGLQVYGGKVIRTKKLAVATTAKS